jgi:hypothetical protein
MPQKNTPATLARAPVPLLACAASLLVFERPLRAMFHQDFVVRVLELPETPREIIAKLIADSAPPDPQDIQDRLAGLPEEGLPPVIPPLKHLASRLSWNAWVMERNIASLLEAHPKPFDRAATLRLGSERLAELIRSLTDPWDPRESELDSAEANGLGGWPRDLMPWGLFYLRDELDLPDPRIPRGREALRAVDNPLGKLLVYSVFHPVEVVNREHLFRWLAMRRGTAAVLGLMSYEARRGALPASLEELVSQRILPSVPMDPFTGAVLGYSRTRRLVWSAGPGLVREPPEPSGRSDYLWEVPERR